MASAETPYSQLVGVAGTATINVRVLGGIQTWTITQVSVEEPNAPAGATCELRKNGNLISPLIPTGDVAAGDPPVKLRPGDTMTLVWTGCTAGSVAKAFVMYDDGTG